MKRMFLGFILGISVTLNVVFGVCLNTACKKLDEKEKSNESPADMEQK